MSAETIAQLEALAYVDRATRLPNRTALERELAQSDEGAIGAVALLRLAWIGFGVTSAAMTSVDHVRASASRRIREKAIAGLDIFAYDDHTFALLFKSGEAVRTARGFALDLLREFDRPLDAGEAQISARPAIGFARRTDESASAVTLFADAHTALEVACERDESMVDFSPALRTAALRHVGIDAGLRKAIAANELSLVYQPAIGFETGAIVAIEALVRWNSAEFGRVSAGELIANAEASGYIERIGEWVIDRALADFSALPLGDEQRPRLCINVSARELRRRDFYGMIDHTAAKYGVPWDDLEIELSETAIVDDWRSSGAHILRGLRERGARISLDDFGTGYSSLKNVSQLPLDSVKIDPSFVRSLGEDPIKRLIVGSLVELSRQLKIRTVAEGAETAEEIAAIRELGCEAAQGYAIARPMDVTELARFLRSFEIQRRATRA